MKLWALTFLTIFMAGAWAYGQAPSTDLHTLRALTNQQAMQRFAVDFEATVTYYRDYDSDLFVQDGNDAIYVAYRAGARLVPGDRVRIRGKIQESFKPIVVADDVTVLRHGALPKPLQVTAAELFSGVRDSLLGTVRGTVHSAQMVWSSGRRNIYLQVLIDGGYIDAAVNSDDSGAVDRLLDSDVEMTGIITSEFDQKMQQSGARLDIQSLADVRILKPASTRPEDLPVTPMESVLSGYHIRDVSQRIQVKGSIIYYQPRRAVVLQSGNQSIWIATQTDVPLQVGDIAYASGFPNVRNGYLILDHGELRDTHQPGPITPRPLNWNEIGFGEYAFMLVTAEGQLVMQARESSQDEYVFTSHGQLFSAIYRHPRGMSAAELPPMKKLAVGSQVRVRGINMFYSSDPFDGPVESNLLLRGFDDITVLAPPSLLSQRNLELTSGLLALIVLLVAGWGWRLERNMYRQAAQAAADRQHEADIERRRSGILEKINGTGPLDEILRMVAELASSRFGGAPCWCETRDGARFGNYPADLSELTIVGEELRAGSGAILGHIHVALAAGAEPPALKSGSLQRSASLASLAIETRRLYADLVHRSEFDNLTDAHSRYFLERELEMLIDLAQGSGDSFGLIYFDLDGFKRVNDAFGHRVGDEYLQQVAQRIKGQLRSQDKLARLGGDEFAVLVPLMRSRNDMQEIVMRLQASLTEPIVLEGSPLQCSASFGVAIYPEDGSTRDELLDIADAAMYSNKIAKKI
jgi:diguanylate cyclase (GGDEF)-like protein